MTMVTLRHGRRRIQPLLCCSRTILVVVIIITNLIVVLSLLQPTILAFPLAQRNNQATQHDATTRLDTTRVLLLLSVTTKSSTNTQSEEKEEEEDSSTRSSTSNWDQFKTFVWDSVDDISSAIQRHSSTDDRSNILKGQVFQGYKDSNVMYNLRTTSSSDKSLKSKTTNAEYIYPKMEKLLDHPSVTSFRRAAGVISVQKREKEKLQFQKRKSMLDHFKSGFYDMIDFVTTGPSSPSETTTSIRRLPSSNQQQTEGVGTSIPIVKFPVPSKKSSSSVTVVDNHIRQQEGQARAKVRKDEEQQIRIVPMRAKKEDLYKIVDKLQATVDAMPETFDSIEDTVMEMIVFSKTIHRKLDQAVQEIQELPDKVEQQAVATQQSMESTIQRTQQVVKDIQEFPHTVNQSILQTKMTIANTTESIKDTVTNLKVLVGLLEEKPQSSNSLQNKKKKRKEIALDVLGKAAGWTGKLALWTSKNTAVLAWKGVKVAYDNVIPALEEAIQKQQEEEQAAKAKTRSIPKPPITPPPDTILMKNDEKHGTKVSIIRAPEEMANEIAQAQALAKEVEEALAMAELALSITNTNETIIPDDTRVMRGKRSK